ncbi:MAG: hypothetical protein ACK4YV_09150 [Emticicia sp.]
MKKLLLPTLIVCALLSACDTAKQETSALANLDGHWLNQEYLEALEASHSPKNVAENYTFYATELIYDQSKGDSIMVFNGQAEFANLPIKRHGDTLSLKLNQDAQTDIIYSASTKTLIFTDKKLNRVFRFVRADSSLIDKSFTPKVAFPSAVNKATFEGKWDIYEHLSTKKSGDFSRFGTIKGWDKYDSYTVCVNGDCVANEDGDVIFLGTKDTSDAYGFRSKGDSITIFELKQINDEDEKPIYKHGMPLILLAPSPRGELKH